uniref:NR LBD domain-containing protein n=2 Tax=Caenorhabditis tropicalis TaxID=1561998 RepID=A0A1I7TAP7_9PELO
MISLKFCKVCDRKSQGIHFGVSSCRACAAFFRRRAGSNLIELSCMNSKCGVEFYLCKPCRLKRCHAVGMDVSKFQFDRDVLTSSKMPQSFDKFVGRPQFVHFCDPDAPTSSKFIDLTFLMEKGEKILKSGPSWGPHSNKGPLQKLANFHNVFEKMPRNMATNSTFSPGDCSDCWEYYFLTTATWLTNFDEFEKLEHPMKMRILFGIWHMWGRLDKLASTALARRRNQLKVKSEIAQSNGLFLDVDKLELDVSWLCNYSLEEVEFFIDGFRQWDLMETVEMFIELDPSPIELNYMLAQMSFYYAGNRFQGEILEIMERFQQILSDDLHQYYVNERKMNNYSGRLMRLMKINNAVQESVRKRRPKTEIAKTLNIFTAEFSHPEMFFDTGF